MTEAPHRCTTPETLVGYHAEVADAVLGLGSDLARGADSASAVRSLDQRLSGPGAALFLDGGPGGREAALDAVRRRLERPGPVVPSNPRGPDDVARILLLHRVDALWWGHVTPYADATAVATAPGLEPLAGHRFDFAVQANGWWERGREGLRRRVQPHRAPAVSGLKYVVARRPVVEVLTDLAGALASRTDGTAPRLWVNSVVRSVEHQHHLASLGYIAELPSAHCVGWAADLEVQWFERFGAADTLRGLLLEQRDAGLLNVIDEGQAWHVCLSPRHPRVLEGL